MRVDLGRVGPTAKESEVVEADGETVVDVTVCVGVEAGADLEADVDVCGDVGGDGVSKAVDVREVTDV